MAQSASLMTPDEKMKEMGSGRILPLILKYAWPAVVTMTLNQLYNVIDRIYIGHITAPENIEYGKDAIAGLGLTFPIMGALAAVGVLIGMGSSTVMSIRLGAKDRHGAERALGSCVAMKLLFGLIFPPLMYFFGFRPILSLMAGKGVTPEALELARRYLEITIFFNIFAHLGFGLSAMMRAEGSPKQSMCCMIVGCVTNLILDPLFIFDSIPIFSTGLAIPGLGLRVAGAAWATNISMIATCTTAFLFYLRKKSVVRLRLRRIWIYRDITPQSLAIGLSPCLMQLMGAFIMFSLNHAFAKWAGSKEAGTIFIGAFSIASTVSFCFFIPSIGIQQGTAPIIGYNWGAENYVRVKRSLKLGLKLTAVATILACGGMELFARICTKAFANDNTPEVIDTATTTIRITSAMIWSIFINVAATTYFQATGRPRISIVLSLLRQCLILLPIVWILPHFMKGHEILAVWLAMPISDIVTQIATLPPIIKEFRWLNAKIKDTTSQVIS